MARNEVKALAFDVFGTVVDYRSTIIKEGEELNQAKGWQVDWGRFSDEWRGRYRPSLARVIRGEWPWQKLDALHRLALEEVLAEFGLSGLSEAEKSQLNKVWHRLQPWPDAVAGLCRLRQKFIVATLSNGNLALLVNMAKHSGLPWDCILSAELFKAYKPEAQVYQGAASLLDLEPSEVMLVAAHPDDLRAAKAAGLKTAFVPRPLEAGPGKSPDLSSGPEFDLVAQDFLDLAEKLGI